MFHFSKFIRSWIFIRCIVYNHILHSLWNSPLLLMKGVVYILILIVISSFNFSSGRVWTTTLPNLGNVRTHTTDSRLSRDELVQWWKFYYECGTADKTFWCSFSLPLYWSSLLIRSFNSWDCSKCHKMHSDYWITKKSLVTQGAQIYLFASGAKHLRAGPGCTAMF